MPHVYGLAPQGGPGNPNQQNRSNPFMSNNLQQFPNSGFNSSLGMPNNQMRAGTKADENQPNMLEVYKWKLAFDGYRDRLP